MGTEDCEFRNEDEIMAGLRAGLETSFREFDKFVLTVSSGILALSVVFFDKSGVAHSHVNWLIASWIAFLLAILSVAASLWVEQAHKKRLILNNGASDEKERQLFKMIGWLNWLSGGTFLLGIVLLVVYLWVSVIGAK